MLAWCYVAPPLPVPTILDFMLTVKGRNTSLHLERPAAAKMSLIHAGVADCDTYPVAVPSGHPIRDPEKPRKGQEEQREEHTCVIPCSSCSLNMLQRRYVSMAG